MMLLTPPSTPFCRRMLPHASSPPSWTKPSQVDPLSRAIRRGSLREAKEVLESDHGGDYLLIGCMGLESPLSVAMLSRTSVALFELLLWYGAPLQRKDGSGKTPLQVLSELELRTAQADPDDSCVSSFHFALPLAPPPAQDFLASHVLPTVPTFPWQPFPPLQGGGPPPVDISWMWPNHTGLCGEPLPDVPPFPVIVPLPESSNAPSSPELARSLDSVGYYDRKMFEGYRRCIETHQAALETYYGLVLCLSRSKKSEEAASCELQAMPSDMRALICDYLRPFRLQDGLRS